MKAGPGRLWLETATLGEPLPVRAASSCGMPYEYTVIAGCGVNPVRLTLAESVLVGLLLTASRQSDPSARLAA